MDHNVSDTAPLDWSHAVQDIPSAGLKAERTASSTECAALAKGLGILGCSSLTARYEIASLSSRRQVLSGTLEAHVIQSCVVTLEPVESTLSAAFKVEFRPSDELPEGASGDFDPLETIEIETLQDGRVPVGRIVYEHIAAALDPYPRASDAQFSWTESEPPEGEGRTPSPFDVLKQLRPKT